MSNPINPAAIPLLMRDAIQWATRRAKVPYISGSERKASSTDPKTWGTFEDAKAAVEAGKADGLYYALLEGSGIVGIDLDHCVEDGVIASWAMVYVRLFNSWTCISPSGTGIRIFIKAKKSSTDCKRGNTECYELERFLSVTDQRVPGTPDTIEERQAELDAFMLLAFPPKPKPERKSAPASTTTTAVNLTDDERFAAAMRSPRFKRLHNGDTSDYGGGDSEARIAYLNSAAWYSGKNPAAMERWIRASSLNAAKFDDSRRDTTFLQTEIDDAIGYVDGEYDPNYQAGPVIDRTALEKIESSGSDGAQACRGCIERDQVIAVQRERIAKLMADNNGGRFSNLVEFRKTANLSGKRKDVVEALAFEIDSARKAGRSEVTLYYGDREARKEGRDPGGLASVAGTSPATVGTVVDEIRTRQESPWQFQTIMDRENGVRRVVAKFNPQADIASDLAAVAAIPRVTAQHGGARPGCPDHPNADLIIRRQTICADCGQVVDESQSRVCGDPLLQVATRPPEAADRGYSVSKMSSDSTRVPVEPDPLLQDAARSPDPMAEALERIRQRHRGDVPPDDPAADAEQEVVSEAWNWRPAPPMDDEELPEPFDLWEERATVDPDPLLQDAARPAEPGVGHRPSATCQECRTAEARPGGLYCPSCMEAFYEANPYARAAMAKVGAA